MPLMWAHAEYIKLLRSVRDGRVFDLIPTVADRYLRKRGRNDLEVWKPVRQVRRVRVGQTLRIQAPRPFQLHWSRDDWQSAQDKDSTATLLGIHFLDIPVAAPQTAPIRFTFLWCDNTQWEGRDYEVAVRGESVRETKVRHARA
ncbi:MAG TPA: hypothetical protein VEV41_07285 [Terriglobales bacterium]|nr:hypothetical protein [Terriglobales bacterium]